MRILLLHNHYKEAGGEDTVFYAEANLLKGKGHQVKTVTFSNKEVNTLLEKVNAALGVVYNFKSAQKVEKAIRDFNPDVVHVHNFFPLASPAVFDVCYTLKVPVVMTLHNYRLICPSALLHYNGLVQMQNVNKVFPLKPVLQGVYRNSKMQTASVVLTTGIHKLFGTWRQKVNKFIALTPGGASLFLNSSLNINSDQIAVKPNFSEDLEVGEEQRENFFLYIGRLTPEKGIRTLLKAHELVGFRLKIIGDGPLRSEVENYTANNEHIEYLGFKPRVEAIEILKRAKALIFPSEWLETFGMTIIEAFSTGTPVIAAKIGGAEHLVTHKQNGLHYAPQNAKALAEQVQKLEQDTELAMRLGKQARVAYENSYTADANYQMLIHIYKSVITLKKKTDPAT